MNLENSAINFSSSLVTSWSLALACWPREKGLAFHDPSFMVSIWSLDIRRWTHWGQALTPATINVMANKNIWKQIRRDWLKVPSFLKSLKMYLSTHRWFHLYLFSSQPRLSTPNFHPDDANIKIHRGQWILVKYSVCSGMFPFLNFIFWMLIFLTQLLSLHSWRTRGEIPTVIPQKIYIGNTWVKVKLTAYRLTAICLPVSTYSLMIED